MSGLGDGNAYKLNAAQSVTEYTASKGELFIRTSVTIMTSPLISAAAYQAERVRVDTALGSTRAHFMVILLKKLPRHPDVGSRSSSAAWCRPYSER
jgi:hypothetical protein